MQPHRVIILFVGGILQFEEVTARRCSVVGTVTINSGGRFKSNDAGTQNGHRLVIYGNVTNNGILDFSTNNNLAGARIIYRGSGDAIFSGTGDTTDLYRHGLQLIDPAFPTYTPWTHILELAMSNLTIEGVSSGPTPPFFGMYTGTLKISGTFPLTCSIWGTNSNPIAYPYYLGSGLSGLWMDNPNFVVAPLDTSGSFCNLRITQGSFNVGTTGLNRIFVGDTTLGNQQNFLMEGGELNVGGWFGMTYAGGTTSTFTQTGGTIRVATIGHTRSDIGSFEIYASNNVFTMSGGNIIIEQRSTGATALDYYVATANVNITGGTLQIGTGSTATNFDFRVRGAMPNVIIDNTTNPKSVLLTAAASVWKDLTINTGTTFSLNGYACTFRGAITNNGTFTANAFGSNVTFAGTSAQALSGTITVNEIASVTMNNSAGASIPQTMQFNNGMILTSGTLSITGNLTLGTGSVGTFVYNKGDGSLSVSGALSYNCLLYTSPSPRDRTRSRMPSSA